MNKETKVQQLIHELGSCYNNTDGGLLVIGALPAGGLKQFNANYLCINNSDSLFRLARSLSETPGLISALEPIIALAKYLILQKESKAGSTPPSSNLN